MIPQNNSCEKLNNEINGNTLLRGECYFCAEKNVVWNLEFRLLKIEVSWGMGSKTTRMGKFWVCKSEYGIGR